MGKAEGMMANRNHNDGGQRTTRWPSPWFIIALIGFLTVGVRQMLHPAVNEVKAARSEPFVPAIQPPETVPAGYHHSVVCFGTGNLVVDQLEKLLQDLQAETDANHREELIANYLAGLKAGDISAALGVLKNIAPPDLAGDLSQRLVQRWAGSNPQAVAAWITSLSAGQQRQAAVDGLAIAWANSQVTNAISWGQSLTDEAERNRALVAVANEAVRADPMLALQLAVDLPADAQRDDLVRRAAMEWASKDALSAVAWAEKIPGESLRTTVLANEATAWADQDPEAAAILAVDELPAGRLQEDTVVSIVERWRSERSRRQRRPGWTNFPRAPYARRPFKIWSPNGRKPHQRKPSNGWPNIRNGDFQNFQLVKNVPGIISRQCSECW